MNNTAPADIAKRCEAAFQAGKPRVLTFTADGADTGRYTVKSGAEALRMAFPGERVYARRKVAGAYAWVHVGTAT